MQVEINNSLCDVLPVSLHVLEAGEGGGGISNRSAFSLFLLVEDPGKTLAEVEAVLVERKFSEILLPLLLTGDGAARILKRQTSVRFQAEFCNMPTLGVTPDMLKPVK